MLVLKVEVIERLIQVGLLSISLILEHIPETLDPLAPLTQAPALPILCDVHREVMLMNRGTFVMIPRVQWGEQANNSHQGQRSDMMK